MLAAVVETEWTGPVAVALVVIGFILSFMALTARDRAFQQSHPESRRTNRIANVVVVTISAAGGFMAAESNEGAWFAAVIFCGMLLWWARPGMMG